MNFFVKDKVLVYATLNGVPLRSPGEVIAVEPDRLKIRMKEVLTSREIYAHPKQCRKIKPSQRLWMEPTPTDGSIINTVSTHRISSTKVLGWLELFIKSFPPSEAERITAALSDLLDEPT